MHRHSTTLDNDFYRLSADDGPVWWLRGDPKCEPAWRPLELKGTVRVDPRRFEPDRKERRVRSREAVHATRTYLHFVRVPRMMMRVSDYGKSRAFECRRARLTLHLLSGWMRA